MIAMSPSHDLEEAKKCADAGFDGLIIKPFTMTSLDQRIKEILLSSTDRSK
jgi:DNA-binding response OmpR family regulator